MKSFIIRTNIIFGLFISAILICISIGVMLGVSIMLGQLF